MSAPPGGRELRLSPRLIAVAALCAALAGFAASFAGLLVAGGLVAIALFAASAYRPVFATYTYLLTLLFIAGVERGTLVPGVRLNEALLALLLSGACLGWYVRFVRGETVPMRLRPLDVPLAVFVVLSTAWPIAWLMLRGQPPQGSDLAAVLPVCKLVALMVLVRFTVRTEDQLLRCVRLIVWTTAGVALIAIMQALNVGPVVSMLDAFWPSEGGSFGQRGTATLGSSIATGDCIIVGLAMLICCSVRGMLTSWERIGLGCVLGAGVLAAGQFSTWISAAVAGILILRYMPGIRRNAIKFLPFAGIAALIGAPAFLSRLAGFGDGFGVPRSWLGRWDNLTHFYLPQLGDFRFVFGVSPDSVLAAPETWREEIYLESGYLQFLWTGGIPLLAAFIWLSVAVLRAVKPLRAEGGAVGVCATTLGIAWSAVLVLSVIDIHLVVRGFGDLLFVLLAIVGGRFGDGREPREHVAARARLWGAAHPERAATGGTVVPH